VADFFGQGRKTSVSMKGGTFVLHVRKFDLINVLLHDLCFLRNTTCVQNMLIGRQLTYLQTDFAQWRYWWSCL
jgi:hypothetical protein